MTPDGALLQGSYTLAMLAALVTVSAAIITTRHEGSEWLAGALAAQSLTGALSAWEGAQGWMLGLVPALQVLTGHALWRAVYQRQRRRHPVPWLVPLALGVLLCLWNAPGAVVVGAAYLAMCCAVCIHALLRRQYLQPGVSTPLLAAALLLVALASLYASLGEGAGGDWLVRQTGWLLVAMSWLQLQHDRLEAHSRRLATMDPHTGAANRRTIMLALERDLGRAIRLREPLSVLMVGIDHFRQINDEHGSAAGDEVLSRVAARLNGRLRSQDLVGRYGGDEFLIVLPSTEAAGALELATQLCETVAVARHEEVGLQRSVTVSIGVYGAIPIPGDRAELFVEAATRALFLAKQHGRNRVEQVGDVHASLESKGREGGSTEQAEASLSNDTP